jgi:2-keto-4-pentenoate hydratase
MTLECSANLRDDGRFSELFRELAQPMSQLRVNGPVFIAPRVEVELAFVLRSPLNGNCWPASGSIVW